MRLPQVVFLLSITLQQLGNHYINSRNCTAGLPYM
jgi:hypothetical protein